MFGGAGAPFGAPAGASAPSFGFGATGGGSTGSSAPAFGAAPVAGASKLAFGATPAGTTIVPSFGASSALGSGISKPPQTFGGGFAGFSLGGVTAGTVGLGGAAKPPPFGTTSTGAGFGGLGSGTAWGASSQMPKFGSPAAASTGAGFGGLGLGAAATGSAGKPPLAFGAPSTGVGGFGGLGLGAAKPLETSGTGASAPGFGGLGALGGTTFSAGGSTGGGFGAGSGSSVGANAKGAASAGFGSLERSVAATDDIGPGGLSVLAMSVPSPEVLAAGALEAYGGITSDKTKVLESPPASLVRAPASTLGGSGSTGGGLLALDASRAVASRGLPFAISSTSSKTPGKASAPPSASKAVEGASERTAAMSVEIARKGVLVMASLQAHCGDVCSKDDMLRREGDELDSLDELLLHVDQLNVTIASHLDLVTSQQKTTRERLCRLLDGAEKSAGQCESLHKHAKQGMLAEIKELAGLLETC